MMQMDTRVNRSDLKDRNPKDHNLKDHTLKNYKGVIEWNSRPGCFPAGQIPVPQDFDWI